jgi:Effector-associated domain 10
MFQKKRGMWVRNFDGNDIKPELQQTINSVVASGKGAVAIGGSANGATIVTGNGNVLGNNNNVQKVEQRGKYNVNLGSASNLNIGDTIYQDRE